MEQVQLNWIANFIWGIADDVLRDLYVRGKYRYVILSMTVLHRLDVVLEPAKQAVLDMKASLDIMGIVHQDQALRQAADQAFYNTSKFTLRDLKARASRQQLKADFEAYLDGFLPNIQDILENFEFRNQIPRLSKADALGTLIEKFLSFDINLSPNPVFNEDCELSEEDIQLICDTFLAFKETEQSKIFPNATFGYWKVTVERPLRLKGIDPERVYSVKEIKNLKETAERDESAFPVIRKIHRKGTDPDPLRGLFATNIDGKPSVVDYEPDPALRDTEVVLSALRDRGVIPYSEKGNIGNKKSDDITRYKVVRPDDIVMNSMNVIIGSVGLSITLHGVP